ncbi:uncharacterized protein LOC129738028 [Uranotaenia lowii]|uniref:uncharacterized protein LOC129738028 n=1 Tax=Uranotaenia lowii TaxID=190385 RepID=UPI002478ED26|nr:uncharacterized protein LOC129738028 [Uranotaenia lowii]
MIRCIVKNCRWVSNTFDLLLNHVKRMHYNLNLYQCNYSDCDRSFGNFRTFRDHYKKHYGLHFAFEINRKNSNMIEDVEGCGNEKHGKSNERFLQSGRNNNTQNDKDVDIDELTSQMQKASINFYLKWSSKESVPRKLVFDLQKDIERFFIKPMETTVLRLADGGNLSEDLKTTLLRVLQSGIQESEYKFLQRLKALDIYEDPIVFTISNQLKPGVRSNVQKMVSDHAQGVLLPIKFHLTKYLESPNMMDLILRSITPSDDSIIRNVIDGTEWKQKIQRFESGIILPLNIFTDDFNLSDTASTHSKNTSICGIYYNIPCLPTYVLSKLSNTLTAGFVKTLDKKHFDIDVIFAKLIDVLEDLEINGLELY